MALNGTVSLFWLRFLMKPAQFKTTKEVTLVAPHNRRFISPKPVVFVSASDWRDEGELNILSSYAIK